jgi:NADH dehydrogenase
MPIDPATLLVTGANGVLARHLFRSVAGAASAGRAAAVVRSETAAETVRALPEPARPAIHVVDYQDVDGLAAAMKGRRNVVHLVGILKESKRSRYADAHEGATEAVAEAAARSGVERIVYLSILGAGPAVRNPCLASKGRAEELLLSHAVPSTVIRLPMVLGGDDQASRALRREACARVTPLLGGGRSLEQPIDADDVVAAVLASLERFDTAKRAYDLGGPVSLPHRELVLRIAALHGTRPRIVTLPVAAARMAARLAERVSDDPTVTEAMLDVLLHDDDVDPETAREAFGIELTPFDTMLARRVGPGSGTGQGDA